MEVNLHREAKRELKEAAAYYESKRSDLGKEFLREVREAMDGIASHPRIHAPILDEVRRLNLARFPYAIIFEPLADRVRVYAVMHARRRPWYWKKRMD